MTNAVTLAPRRCTCEAITEAGHGCVADTHQLNATLHLGECGGVVLRLPHEPEQRGVPHARQRHQQVLGAGEEYRAVMPLLHNYTADNMTEYHTT